MAHILLLIGIYAGILSGDEMNFTASTPAGKTIRTFLGIDQRDSIDFIRWKLRVTDHKTFDLSCSYGMAKPNTNGFIGDKNVGIRGSVTVNDGTLTLSYEGKRLDMLVLNSNIMHLLYSDGTMMVGNGGWSYTLNTAGSPVSEGIALKAKSVTFIDSVVFDGRTPCKGIEELMMNKTRPECYKKKWRVTLYKDPSSPTSGTYKIGTVEARTGKWKMKIHSTGRPVYILDLNNGNTLNLYHADENIVYLMDRNDGLMIGDHDFSYSLNRKDYPDH